MKAIVTGADGFVGSYVTKNLLAHGYEVLAVDLGVTPKRLDVSNPHLKYLQHSIEDVAFFSEACKPGEYDFFFHFAWKGSAGLERCDEKIQLTNALQAAQCLRKASEIGCRRFICAGSIMEYETNQVVYEQGSEPGMAYIYGAGKTIAHEICKPIANSLGIDLVWSYITNAYGVGESSPRFLNSTIRKIIHGERLEFTSGTQNYDFIYVTDVAKAFRLIAEKGIKNKSYLIGSGEAKPLRSFIEDILNELKPAQPAIFGEIPYNGVLTPLGIYSITEIQKDCGFIPEVPFKKGLRLTYEWLKEMK
jgi:nucleoside-diphosphate-sugar epimerase